MNINGLLIINDFITDEEEEQLIRNIENNNWNNDLKRLTQQYGYKYNYEKRNITDEDYLNVLPLWLLDLAMKVKNSGLIKEIPDQVIINRYLPGEGIYKHIDNPHIFGDQIFSISLHGNTSITFGEILEIYIPRKTLMLMEGDARYRYTHEIKKRMNDVVNGTKIKRDIRYSITFRKMKF